MSLFNPGLNQQPQLSCGGRIFLLSVHPECDGLNLLPDTVSIQESSVLYSFKHCTVSVTAVANPFTGIEGARLRVESFFSGKGKWSLSCQLESGMRPDAQLFVPAVSYRANSTGAGAFPKGGLEAGWEFHEDRMPLCGCVSVYDSRETVFVHLQPSKDKPFASIGAAWSETKKGHVSVACRIPETERPTSYQGKTAVRIPEAETLTVVDSDSPAQFCRTLYVSVFNEPLLAAYEKMVAAVSADSILPSDDLLPADKFYRLKMHHLEYLLETAKDGSGEYLLMGRGNGSLQSVYNFTGASFLVKSLEAAVIFAKQAKRETDAGRKAACLTHAVQIGNYFLQAERASGIFCENHDLKTGEWGGYLGIGEHPEYAQCVNARCCGEAILAYVELYEQLRAQNIDKSEFRDLAIRVAEFFVAHQLPTGSFGRWWTADGKAVDSAGTNGAYIVPVLLALKPYASRYADAIRKAGDWYRQVIDREDFYGDTLDADACDKESAVVLLRMCLDLFDDTGDRSWLVSARKAARFALTWIWQHDIAFDPDSTLAKEHFHTLGMTSVSVAHHHMDFYGLYIAVDFFRLYKHTGEELYNRQGRLLADACRQLVSRPGHELGKSGELLGWQPEQINYTQWDYFDRPECMKGHFDICIAWVTVLQLGAMQRIEEMNA